MFDRLAEIESKYNDLADQVNDPEMIANQSEWRKRMKEYSDMSPVIEAYQEYKKVKAAVEEGLELLNDKLDEDFRELVKEEFAQNKERLEELKQEITILLLPKDPNDEKNVIVEIRGGAGGDEAALFAGDLFRMYARYAEDRRWKVELMNASESDLGGFKEVSFMITGKGAYSRMKYESGVHRVQRIPTTESGGRIHTSTVTVAVMPEAEEVDVHIDMNEVRVDVFRASGNGGQCVNTTDSAVRMTHLPTGIVVSCQNEKSQLKNKEQALKVLYARVYERERQAHDAAISADRRSQVGTGDRSERIRTYNFPQGRITDHRIGLTLYKIDSILDGDLDELMNALITTDRMEKMQAGGLEE
ncbi:peptide chain release factor 1 [Anaerotignum propionicum]|jgi:peptide chain release factor 1|uniref:Peptide chain release factor 1 n=1 Tax=Anaerotignum propionicum DSM 1682 TaxID=991789 RepID=A0A110A7N5_ANAPI|nr:peptide chain release factor 1 [Anaerotignum propionicum]AMJ42423.1 peptide chain release factor 1 [Anaerotignum propionicum DSM 1682]MEA5056749.1 peptide chain release factor 1 [Anaerotignum propionicum]SHE34916.1 bacterial peptide chain release factor 1 (bRF-1) [[Clostridium] propionicum DSM 1682] [Anaerotignum propionicum DSM 1682]